MACDIRDMLHGFAGPFGTSNQTTHHILRSCRIAGRKTAFMVKRRTDKRITDIIAEGADAGHLIGPLFHSQRIIRISRRHSRPTFAVRENSRIDLVQRRTDGIHGLLVMDAHEVKTETIHMVLTRPVTNGLDHELAVLLVVRGSLITATGTVGIRTIRIQAIEIFRHHSTQRATHHIVRVVIYNIHNHAYASLMKRLNHHFRLANTRVRVIRISAITSVRHIVIDRIVAPVIWRIEDGAWRIVICLINRTVVEERQNLEMCNTEFFEIVDGW